MMIKKLVLGLCIIGVASCSPKTSTSTVSSTNATSTKDFAKEGYVKASVVDRSALDGCGFMLQLQKTSRFLEPNKMDKSFHVQGMQVWIKYSTKKGGASICMSGTMVNLNAIEKRQ